MPPDAMPVAEIPPGGVRRGSGGSAVCTVTIDGLDADVTSIEAARSRMELVDDLNVVNLDALIS